MFHLKSVTPELMGAARDFGGIARQSVVLPLSSNYKTREFQLRGLLQQKLPTSSNKGSDIWSCHTSCLIWPNGNNIATIFMFRVYQSLISPAVYMFLDFASDMHQVVTEHLEDHIFVRVVYISFLLTFSC